MASLSSVKQWDQECDILICGYGLSGAVTAIEAYDADPDVNLLIIDKVPEEFAGGNSRVAGQSLLMVNNADALVEYQRAMSVANPIPEDMLRTWAERMVELEGWVKARAEEVGSEFIRGTGFNEHEAILEFPEFGAAEAVNYTATILPIPSGVWLAFKKNVEKRNIPVQFECTLLDLIQDPDTLEVFGARVLINGEEQSIRARKAVVMATGGFEANQQMQRDYYGLPDAVPMGTPYNTGDGLKILQKAGADMWHLRNLGQSGGIWPSMQIPGKPTSYLRNWLLPAFSWFDVDADGRRCYPETNSLQTTHYKIKKHGRHIDSPLPLAGPMHMIFDSTTMNAGKLALEVMGWSAVVDDYQWSDDNTGELELGLIVKADTIEELAEKISKPADVLAEELSKYNQSCEAGVDEEYGRRAETLYPIQGPPYYAMRLVPGIVCTGGGARRNIESEVLDHNLQPIPRLFEVGELGSMFSDLYQNGSYLTECMISGRAAGKNVLKLSDWQSG